MQRKGTNTWIVCGVIALVVVCGGAFFLLGGLGLLAYIGGQITPTPETALVVPDTEETPAPPAKATVVSVATVPSGDIDGIPYKAVVQIIAFAPIDGKVEAAWTGSGSIVSQDGLILTNAHVVLSDRYYQVDHLVVALTIKPDEQPVPSYIVKVLQADRKLDIAVVRIESDLDGNPVDRGKLNLPTVQMGDSETLSLGDALTIIGYPGIGGETVTLTKGEVSGFTAEKDFGNRAFIKTSATIAGGNSGGLAANANGQIIGVPTQLGYGGEGQYVDCRALVDTNRDGVIDDKDSCVPAGGFINALRPLKLAMPLIDAARRGEINIKESAGSEQVAAPTAEPSKIVFQDDFSDPKTGWDVDDWDGGAVKYEDGEYLMTVKKAKWLVWSNLGDEMQDLAVSVDTRIIDPTGGGDYGVICRYQDEKNFYGLEVSEDGYYSVWKMENDEFKTISDWAFSDQIPADRPFKIQAVCADNHLMLGVDGNLLADVTDDSFQNGKYGLVVGTYEKGGLTVAFDNFTVYKP
jgi:S1-C subfamily serine protease